MSRRLCIWTKARSSPLPVLGCPLSLVLLAWTMVWIPWTRPSSSLSPTSPCTTMAKSNQYSSMFLHSLTGLSNLTLKRLLTIVLWWIMFYAFDTILSAIGRPLLWKTSCVYNAFLLPRIDYRVGLASCIIRYRFVLPALLWVIWTMFDPISPV
jgi:hypothetical protein